MTGLSQESPDALFSALAYKSGLLTLKLKTIHPCYGSPSSDARKREMDIFLICTIGYSVNTLQYIVCIEVDKKADFLVEQSEVGE